MRRLSLSLCLLIACQIGDLILPAAARLRTYRFRQNDTVQGQLFTMARVSAGTSGVLLSVKVDAEGSGHEAGYEYLEGCMRAVIDGASSPLFLSSGAEDYFLSAYYFDEGQYRAPGAGLTHKHFCIIFLG